MAAMRIWSYLVKKISLFKKYATVYWTQKCKPTKFPSRSKVRAW
jgi:hypothetical protein